MIFLRNLEKVTSIQGGVVETFGTTAICFDILYNCRFTEISLIFTNGHILIDKSSYSWVPIKQISIINEYRVNSKRIINEYNLINQYTGMNYDYSKQVYGQISKKNGVIPYFCKISMQNWLKYMVFSSKCAKIMTFKALN